MYNKWCRITERMWGSERKNEWTVASNWKKDWPLEWSSRVQLGSPRF
jgi:hypothetical protein